MNIWLLLPENKFQSIAYWTIAHPGYRISVNFWSHLTFSLSSWSPSSLILVLNWIIEHRQPALWKYSDCLSEKVISTPSTWVHGWLWLEIYFGQNSVTHFFDPDWLFNHKFNLWWGILQPRRIFRCYLNLNFYVMTLSEQIFLTKASMDGKHLLRFIKCKRRRQILPHSHSPQTYVAPTKYCTTDTCKSKNKKTWLRVIACEHRNKSKLIDWLIFTSRNQSQPAICMTVVCEF